MNTAVCTLFEGNYHHGVAALANSLIDKGFRGEIYAGYKGSLPKWAFCSTENSSIDWTGSKILRVNPEVNIHFLPVDTDYHLTNYKPEFMLRLCNGLAKNVDSIAYFDPDIVIKCRWSFFENWMNHGVALVHEITANDMPRTHPIRLEWKKVIEKISREETHILQSYINAGFCGITRKNLEFVELWSEIIKVAIKYYKQNPSKFMSFDRTWPFFSIDQDAFNIAAMCTKSPISEVGPEGMDFIHGGWTMSHALGTPKPWNKNYIVSAFKGKAPSLSDKAFWANVNGPINSFTSFYVNATKLSILLASFFGRFYRRY